jgi:phenylacetate-CoA ligase
VDLLKYPVKYLTIPLYDRRENKIVRPYLQGLLRSQYYSVEQIRVLQLERLKSIVSYAAAHCEFYKKRFHDCGFAPDDLRSFDDLSQIPALTKDDIRQNLNDMISDEFRIENLIYKRTGGSTSVPLKLYVDQTATNLKLAAAIRHNRWAGYERGDKLAAVWGDTDKKYSFKEKLYNLFNTRAIYLDTLKMSEEYMMAFVARLQKYRPSVMMGHAHSLYTFAFFIDDHGISDLGIKSIISTAEILYDHERAKIESVFGKILFNRYGCEELSIIASECEKHDGLHINAEGLYIEIAGGDNNEPGRLLITDLWNRGMPFIRYEIGDMATSKSGDCACGRGLPRLGKIYGRTADLLYTPDGRAISGISVLDTFTIHVPGIKQVQIIQNDIDRLNFKVVKGDDFDDGSMRIFEQKIPQFFGEAMKYNIEFVDKIPQTRRGKYRFSICNLQSNKKKPNDENIGN